MCIATVYPRLCLFAFSVPSLVAFLRKSLRIGVGHIRRRLYSITRYLRGCGLNYYQRYRLALLVSQVDLLRNLPPCRRAGGEEQATFRAVGLFPFASFCVPLSSCLAFA